MQVFSTVRFAVRWLSGNGFIFRRTLDRTPAGHLVFFVRENIGLDCPAVLSGTVRWLQNVYCLSGSVSLGRAAPDTCRTMKVFGNGEAVEQDATHGGIF